MKSMKNLLWGIALIALSFSLEAGVKEIPGNPTHIKLSPEITLVSQISLGNNSLSIGEAMTGQFFPRFVFNTEDPSVYYLSTSKRLIPISSNPVETGTAIPVGQTAQFLLQCPGSKEWLISHWIGNIQHISRCRFPSGKITWSMESNYVPRFQRTVSQTISGMGTTTTTYYYPFPTSFTLFPEKKKLFMTGLICRGPSKHGIFSSALPGDWGIRNRVLDITTGQIIQETDFDLQRNITDSLKLFVSLTRREFKVIDLTDAVMKMAGTFEPGDVLARKDFTPPIDMRERINFAWRSDVHPLLIGDKLTICSHWENRKAFKVVHSDGAWLDYDLDGNFIKKISPAPITFIERKIRNQGESPWPMVFRAATHEKGMPMLQRDGSITFTPVPAIDGYPDDRFHDDQFIFILDKNVLYRTKFGESLAKPIYTAPKGKKYNHAPFGADGMVILSGSRNTDMLRLSDGKLIDPKEALGTLSPELYWSLLDNIRLNNKLPRPGLSPKFRYYEDFQAPVPDESTMERYEKDDVQALRLWGTTKSKRLGDILLLPGIIKKGFSVMVGIQLPKNRVLFTLPMGRLKGLQEDDFPDEPGMIYGIQVLDQENALLTVVESFNTLSVYRITRPSL